LVAQLYKEYGTALKGLIAEGYLPEDATDEYLQAVHDIPLHFKRDDRLRAILLQLDPSIPRYIFTASVRQHAERCLVQLGIDDLFVDIIDCKACDLETKHSPHSFAIAIAVATIENRSAVYSWMTVWQIGKPPGGSNGGPC
jgi:FMN phosphatase YigB (HAD superfamily)